MCNFGAWKPITVVFFGIYYNIITFFFIWNELRLIFQSIYNAMNGKHAKSLHIWSCAKIDKSARVYLCSAYTCCFNFNLNKLHSSRFLYSSIFHFCSVQNTCKAFVVEWGKLKYMFILFIMSFLPSYCILVILSWKVFNFFQKMLVKVIALD